MVRVDLRYGVFYIQNNISTTQTNVGSNERLIAFTSPSCAELIKNGPSLSIYRVNKKHELHEHTISS